MIILISLDILMILQESLAKRFGYPFEQYEVETEDGYILSVHRIPFSQKNKMMKGYRPPVLLQHGLFGSSDNWIVTGPGRAPGNQIHL